MPSNTSPAVTPAPIAASPKWNCSGFEFPLVVAGGILWTLMRANRSSEALGLAAARCAAIRSAGVGAVLLGTRGALDIFAKPPLNVAAVPITTSDLSGRLYTAAGIRLAAIAWVVIVAELTVISDLSGRLYIAAGARLAAIAWVVVVAELTVISDLSGRLYTAAGVRLAAIAWVVVVPGSALLDGLATSGLGPGVAHAAGAAIASATATAAVVAVVSRMVPPLVRGSIRHGHEPTRVPGRAHRAASPCWRETVPILG